MGPSEEGDGKLEDGLTTPAPKAYKPNLPALKRMFEEARELTYDARVQALIDQDYYDGNQWTAEERHALQKRKQPDNVFNLTALTVNGTLGVIKQGNTDPRAYPRNPQDADSADVASKVLRFVADHNRFDDLKVDSAAKDYLVLGTCAAIVEVDEDRQITIEPIRFEEFFYDPRSRRKDFKDARYMGVAKWQWADDLARVYADKSTEILASLNAGAPLSLDDTFEDRPKDQPTVWVDKDKRRVLTVELYHQEGGEWYRCVFHAGGELESGPAPYNDNKKRPYNPIIARSCNIDRDNNRYGMVRNMRGPQDEINKRHSKALHELNNRQIRQTDMAAMADVATVRAEAARPDGVLPYGWDVVARTDVVSGQIAMLAEAKSMLERMGPSPEMLGRQNSDASGRAQLVRQQAGMTELAPVFGGIEEWELRIYRHCWDRSRQFWTEPMYIRVTDDEGSPDFVGVNQPRMGPPQVVMGPDGMPAIQPTILGYENRLAELDVDIDIDTVPDTANLQAEQFQMMIELAKIYGPQEIPFDDILDASAMPNKREVIEKRKARMEQAAQQQQQNPMQALQLRGAAAEVAKTEAEAELTGAKAKSEVILGAAKVASTMAGPAPKTQQPAAGGF